MHFVKIIIATWVAIVSKTKCSKFYYCNTKTVRLPGVCNQTDQIWQLKSQRQSSRKILQANSFQPHSSWLQLQLGKENGRNCLVQWLSFRYIFSKIREPDLESLENIENGKVPQVYDIFALSLASSWCNKNFVLTLIRSNRFFNTKILKFCYWHN